ncbi:MAG: hypothetical protein V4671_20595 [Armatimonadota bacterium]
MERSMVRRFAVAGIACLVALLRIGTPEAAAQKPLRNPSAPTPRMNPPISGVVRDSAGSPLRGMILYFPDWQSRGPEGPASVVTADGDGTFMWAKYRFPYSPESSTPSARVLPIDGRRWTAKPVFAQPPIVLSPEFQTAEEYLIDETLQTATTRWEGTGGAARLIVEAPPTGTMKIKLPDTAGNLLRNAPVQVWPVYHSRFPHQERMMRYDGRTDGNGFLDLRLFPGDKEFMITAPGVGFATTGPFKILAGQTATPSIARLVPFATVSGRAAPGLARPGQIVRLGRFLETYSDPVWSWRQTRTDRTGRFVLTDITPGRHIISLFANEADAAKWGSDVRPLAREIIDVSPGVNQEDRRLIPAAPRPTPPPPPTPAEQEPGVLVGVVRSAQDGKPVGGATVWAVCTPYAIGATHITLTTTTSRDGTYRLEGVPAAMVRQPTVGISGIPIIATKDGYAPALGYVNAEEKLTTVPDLVFPANSSDAALTVRFVDAGGRPAVGVTVEAKPDFTDALLGWGFPMFSDSSTGKAAEALTRAFRPRMVTDESGIARFTKLLPGRYDLTADSSGGSGQRGNERAVTYISGVPAGPRTETPVTFRLQQSLGKLQLRLLDSDGHPLTGQGLSYKWVAAVKPTDDNSDGNSIRGNDRQNTFDISSRIGAGLWRITVSQGDFIGQTVAAYSPFQARPSDVLEIGTKKEGPGSLVVTVVDADGKPVRQGTVYRSQYAEYPEQIDPGHVYATDSRGRVTLPGLKPDTIAVRADVEPLLPPNGRTPFPDDSALTNRKRWPATTAVIRPDTVTRITLRPVRVGWIRGTVRGAPQGMFVIPANLQKTLGTAPRYDAESGEYLIGPLPPGAFRLAFSSSIGDKQATLTIRSGAVTRFDFAPVPIAPSPQPGIAALRLQAESVVGSVFLPDGRTPAMGARVIVHYPNRSFGIGASYWADSAGSLGFAPFASPQQSVLTYYEGKSYTTVPVGGPDGPVLVALLPGSHGAKFTPLPPQGTPVRLTLPPALSVAGRVTVAGRTTGSDGQGVIKILAACTGQGRLNDLLSVEAAVQADGTFTLTGLTPESTYTVQAVLDEIWVSPPITVTTGRDTVSPGSPLGLAIPEPGTPVVVALGKSGAGARAFLMTPPVAGPLGRRYAPAFYVADAAGRLRLEGLTAGSHRLRLAGGKVISVTVPTRELAP